MAEHVTGHDQSDATAGEPLMESHQLVGDLAAWPAHRFGRARANDPVARFDRAELPRLEQDRRAHLSRSGGFDHRLDPTTQLAEAVALRFPRATEPSVDTIAQ
jgi:hypothetical protein